MKNYSPTRHQARTLYGAGRTIPDIAAALHMSPTTVSHWRTQDTRDGDGWDELRELARRREPARVLQGLHDQLADLVARGPTHEELSLEPGLYETRVLRLTQAIARFRASSADIMMNLLALEKLATWAAIHCTKAHLSMLRDVVQRYTEDLKHSSESMLA